MSNQATAPYTLDSIEKHQRCKNILVRGQRNFNLDDPEVSQELEEKLSEGKIILGYYGSSKEIEVHLPLEPNDYVQNRIKEVFDV